MRPLVARDGLGLTELEFALAMMLELHVVSIDQVQPFIKQFRLLDIDGNARLSRSDLASAEGRSLAKLQIDAQKRLGMARQMSVGDRMGLSLMTNQDAVLTRTATSAAAGCIITISQLGFPTPGPPARPPLALI